MKELLSGALCVLLVLAACDKEKASEDTANKDSDKTQTSDKAPETKDKPVSEDRAKPPDKTDAGQFSELVTFVNDAANAMKAALLGKKVEGQWADSFPEIAKEKLNEVSQELKAIGGSKHLVTVVELEAIRKSGSPTYVRTMAGVFPDGKIAWMAMSTKSGEVYVSPTPDLAEAAPVLNKGVLAMVELLAGDDCKSIPVIQASDMAEAPAAIKSHMPPAPDLEQMCNVMKGQTGDWQVRVDDVTLLFAGGDKAGVIRTGFQVADKKIHLQAPRFRAQ